MNRIKQLREENRWTQEHLANKLNCAISSIAMYEKEDRKPSLEVLVKLSEIFNCSIDYILFKTDIRNPQEPNDPLGLAQIGFDINNYTPPTETQKEQIKVIIETILKDNKKK
ncbi:helix-turn-helix domain-containing protein [Romboutsia ilealis]|uniref:helix-turn-helix domain-containing protein n=1 Tax=Romboutsia ilealis TaxID=1115758 RepID=UPI002572ED03|nr:helix-turn-helix transcriptional regulator [Romboutsia ilealis]MCI8470329.1 helix-turn-helix transcriptional regulator [Clostridia bacterium]